MVAGAVLTTTADPTRAGAVLTFVTPTRNGCGMRCPYCFIDRRKEVTSGSLLPEHYAQFVADAAKARAIAAVTIQGREPLEPGAMAWTEAILAAAHGIGAETGVVTNGWWLQDAAPSLAQWGCSGVTVSIDADTPEAHDRLRRTPGAWHRALEGLRALAALRAVDRLVVNSLVVHGAEKRLANLPHHLADAGVTLWSLSPMLKFDADGRTSAAISQRQWREALRVLSEHAAAYGVTVIADDEFGAMDGRTVPGVTLRTLSRPQGIMRMGPDGRCAFGINILDDRAGTPTYWHPGVEVSETLRGLAH